MPNVQAARLSAFDEVIDSPPDDAFFSSGESASPEGPEPHAISVATVFRGVGMGARILPFPREVRRQAGSARLLGAGAALLAASLLALVLVAVELSGERDAFSAWTATGNSAAAFAWKVRSRWTDVLFVGGLLSGGALLVMGFARRRRAQDGGRATFLVGSAPEVDAPVDEQFISSPAHALVTAVGDDWLVHPTPRMLGGVSVAGELRSLAELARGGDASFRLPRGARARLVCGSTTFLLSGVRAPARIARPFFRWNRDEHGYTVGAALVLGLFLLMVFSVPPDPRSLSLDLFGNENHLVRFDIHPPMETAETPPWVKKVPGPSGGAGAASAGVAGTMGKKTSHEHDHAFSEKGPKNNPDPRIARAEAANRAKEAGILGIFKRSDSGPLASIFGSEGALGNQAEDVLGNLVGTKIGEAEGGGGLRNLGTGAGGGDSGKGLIGFGHLDTIGDRSAGTGKGPGYGTGVGTLAMRRTTKVPDPILGIASVRGSLDKEIIRRIIRRHINEVKFCYEEELVKKPELAGRLLVQFMISGTGQVISSVLQNSTMGNARVESCTVQAVRRWSFPQPQGGGMVTVTYPFALTPAG
ncbi:MAG TPA: AgmX/PglI C-terminal domain-containing protein [Polyangia bacterium]|jgi:TonB family protein